MLKYLIRGCIILAVFSSFVAVKMVYMQRGRQSGRKMLRREDWIAKCDGKIADLNVKLLIKDVPASAAGADLGRMEQLYVLRVGRASALLWSVAVEAALFGWIAAVLFVVVRGSGDKVRQMGWFVTYGMFLIFSDIRILGNIVLNA